MASGKKRTSFMKLTRDRELAEKRLAKQEKRAARKQAAQADKDPGSNADPSTPPAEPG